VKKIPNHASCLNSKYLQMIGQGVQQHLETLQQDIDKNPGETKPETYG